MIDDTFADFWEDSSLDEYRIKEFSARIDKYDSDNKELILEYPAAPELLKKGKGKLHKISKKRKSDRSFSKDPLSAEEIGGLLTGFYAWNGLEHRGYPSAGATYSTEVFVVTFNTKVSNKKMLYYDSEKHGLVTLGDAPMWDDALRTLNIEITGIPQMLVLLAVFPDRAIAKYGVRGGRFVLLEAGAAMQQLALTIAGSSRLKGVAVGGMLDDYWTDRLNIDNKNGHVALGYLVGK